MSLIPRGFLVAQCDRCQLMLEVDGSEIVFDDINEAVSYMNDREWIVVHEYGEDGFGLVVCDGCSQQFYALCQRCDRFYEPEPAEDPLADGPVLCPDCTEVEAARR